MPVSPAILRFLSGFSGLNGVNSLTHHINFNNCGFIGFDKCITFGSNSWLNSFTNCSFSLSNYGVYFTTTGFTNLGENIGFYQCTLGNNNYNLYILDINSSFKLILIIIFLIYMIKYFFSFSTR